MANTTILVTGATGFLGKNILKAFKNNSDITLIAACRDQSKLPKDFQGEVREGDLRDAAYRQSVVQGIDVICHAGTWSSLWNHQKMEVDNFYQPTIDLIDQAIGAGCKRFLMTSTVAIARVARRTGDMDTVIDDFSEKTYTGFWPHLDRLIDVDDYMHKNAERGMHMVNMRLGHFVGAGNTIGLVPALVPRLKTYLVPWLSGGKSRMPLVADSDIATSFVAVTFAKGLKNYESFNICGADFPTMREVIKHISLKAKTPVPLFSVPYPVGYLFAWFMEKLLPIMPGKSPFLTRSIVHLAEDWHCNTQYAKDKLGYIPQKDWRTALDEALAELESRDYPWTHLAQKYD